MNKLAGDILYILSLEKKAYSELLELAVHKKEVLIKNNAEALNKIVMRETELLKEVEEYETQRIAAVSVIMNISEAEVANVKYDDLLRFVDEISALKLRAMKNELSVLANKLKSINLVNKGLVETHLSYSYFRFNVINQSSVPADTYNNLGQVSESQKSVSGLWDQKV